jgi:hypothetical protein
VQIRDGQIDFGPLKLAAARMDRLTDAQTWWKELAKHFEKDLTTMDVVAFIRIGSSHNILRGLHSQVLLAISLRMEKLMGGQAKQLEKKAESGPISFGWLDLDTSMGGNSMDRRLAQYVLNCEATTASQVEYSMATDKGQVCTLPLQNSVILLANTTALLACPQVDHRKQPHPHPPATTTTAASKSQRALQPARSAYRAGGGVYFWCSWGP